MQDREINRPYVPIPTPELRKRVRLLAAAGASDNEIARAYLFRPTELRERFGKELKAGRGERKPPSPPRTRAPEWTKPPRSGAAMAVQIAWLKAQIRDASPSLKAGSTDTSRKSRAGKEKTDAEILADLHNGDPDAVYDLSDEALEDSIREASAASAALATGDETEPSDEGEPRERALARRARGKEGSLDKAPSNSIPLGARRDEIFADVVHDEPKKVERYSNPWSKGEVLDYLFKENARCLGQKVWHLG
jgi:hypothetical protein